MYGSWDMVRGRQKRVPHLEITMKKNDYISWYLQNWKEQSFNLITGMEGITQLLSDLNVSEDTNVMLLPKRELFF